jgi:hypothetical protein
MQFGTWNVCQTHKKLSQIIKHMPKTNTYIFTLFWHFWLEILTLFHVWPDLVHFKASNQKNFFINPAPVTYYDALGGLTRNFWGNRNDAWETVVDWSKEDSCNPASGNPWVNYQITLQNRAVILTNCREKTGATTFALKKAHSSSMSPEHILPEKLSHRPFFTFWAGPVWQAGKQASKQAGPRDMIHFQSQGVYIHEGPKENRELALLLANLISEQPHSTLTN